MELEVGGAAMFTEGLSLESSGKEGVNYCRG